MLSNIQNGYGNNGQLLQISDLDAYPAFEFQGPDSVDSPTEMKQISKPEEEMPLNMVIQVGTNTSPTEMKQISKPEEEMPLNVVIQVDTEANGDLLAPNPEKSRQSTSNARDGETIRESIGEGPSGRRSRSFSNLPLVAKQASKYSLQNDKLVCSICLESYEIGEKLRKLPCQHTFHAECVDTWLTKKSGTCPLCRTQLKHD